MTLLAENSTDVFVHIQDDQGRFICDINNPIPIHAPSGSVWVHSDVSLIQNVGAVLIRIFENNLLYRCNCCGTEWIINQDTLLNQE